METVYKSSRRMAVYQGVIKGAGLWLAGVVMYGLTAILLQNTFWSIWILIALGAAVLAGIVFDCRLKVMSIAVDQKEVRICYSKKSEKRFPINDTDFGTIVENQTVFGFVYYVKRYLRISGTRYPCYCFPRKTFSKLNARIQEVKNEWGYHLQEITEEKISSEQKIFLIPRLELLQNERKRIQKIGLESLSVAVILFVAWCISNFRRIEPQISVVLTVAAAIVGVLLCLPVISELLHYRKYKKMLPENIHFQESSMIVDGQKIDFSEIGTIHMTPASYTRSGQYSFMRSLKMRCNTGTFEYLLGYTQTKDLQYEDYGQLVEMIEKICGHYQIKFILNL